MHSHITFDRWRASLAGYSIILATLLALMPRETYAGTWTALTTAPPNSVNEALLLSDGTILVDNSGGQCAKLTPDIHGSYINGTWTVLSTMNNARLFFSTQMLTNGTVYVAGGEYGEGFSHGEIFDPLRDVWTKIYPDVIPGTAFGDAPSEILPNGNVLQSDRQFGYYFYNVVSNEYLHGGTCNDMNEVCWVKMGNGCIFAADNYGQEVDHYVPSLNEWVVDSTSPPAGFSGGDDTAFLLPNGKVFHVGSTTNTGLYTPGATVTSAGTLVNGPNLPMVEGTNQLFAGEGPGATLVDGNILLDLAPNGGGASGGSPDYFYEYNYLANTFTPESAPGGGASYYSTPFANSMLDLPDGTVLFIGGQDSSSLYVYAPVGTPLATGAPVIKSITENVDGSYQMTGTGLNGISEGAKYGDDEQMACNYPLVRMTNSVTGNVYYARTFNWNSTGVQTGTNTITTEFTLPQNLPSGTYSLVAEAGGNPSSPQTFAYAPPSIPTPTATSGSNGLVKLKWNVSSGATGYNVKRCSTVTGYYATLATVTGLSFTNSGLTNGLTYYYKVAAIGSGGPSSDSAAVAATPAGPGFIPGATQVSLSGYYNLEGLVTDGLTFSGGIDGIGYAYSATLLPPALWWNNLVFALGPSNAEDVVSCAGQTISLPAGSFSTLQIVAAGVNGNQYGQTFTVTYTDNSTATFTQSFSDWTHPQLYPGEYTVVNTLYLDTSDGGEQSFSGGQSVDGYVFVLDQTKTVKSIELPDDANVVILAMDLASDDVQVPLSAYYNRAGIYTDTTTYTNLVGLDGSGYSYTGTETGNYITWGNSLFAFGALNETNVISCAGQTITLPSGKYAQLQMLGTAVNGGQSSESFTVKYSDNSTTKFLQSLSDWAVPANYVGESNVLIMNYRNYSDGSSQVSTFYLYGYSFNLNTNKTVKSILLPSDANVMVTALSLVPAAAEKLLEPLTTAPPPIQLQISQQAGSVTLNWSGGIAPYDVQMTANLLNPNWEDLGTVSGTNLMVTPSNGPAFYRIVGQSP